MKKLRPGLPFQILTPSLPPRKLDITRLSHPTAVEGETMKPCPTCGSDRQRMYKVSGPFHLKDLPYEASRLKTRRSHRRGYRLLWTLLFRSDKLFLPPVSDEGRVWFAIVPSAKCPTPGCRHNKVWEQVVERTGIRKLAVIKLFELHLRTEFGKTVAFESPQEPPFEILRTLIKAAKALAEKKAAVAAVP